MIKLSHLASQKRDGAGHELANTEDIFQNKNDMKLLQSFNNSQTHLPFPSTAINPSNSQAFRHARINATPTHMRAHACTRRRRIQIVRPYSRTHADSSSPNRSRGHSAIPSLRRAGKRESTPRRGRAGGYLRRAAGGRAGGTGAAGAPRAGGRCAPAAVDFFKF